MFVPTPDSSFILRLPTEVLQIIYSFACVDGGRTGCALSRVSKQMRETSSPFRFYSVALPNLDMLKAFCALLEKVDRLQIIVRHLFIAGPSSLKSHYDAFYKASTLSGVCDNPKKVLDIHRLEEVTHHAFITRILRECSQTLYSMHLGLTQGVKSLRADDFPSTFPVLTQLSFRLQLQKGTSPGWSAQQMFPVLRRINLASKPYQDESNWLAFSSFPAILPTITDLHYSAPETYRLDMAAGALLAAPSALQHVSIQLPYVDKCDARYAAPMARMSEQCIKMAHNEPRLSVNQALEQPTVSSLLGEWLDGIS
jgi:hypothetical protein